VTALSPALSAPEAAGDCEALSRLLVALERSGYRFTTPGGATIALNRRRRDAQPRTLRDIFGWSLDFAREDMDAALFDLAAEARILVATHGRWRSLVRVSAVEGRLFAHSAYPPSASDAVFLGPDSYRFARLVVAEAAHGARSVLDLGTGAGVGAVLCAARLPAAQVVATDVNPAALRLAQVNAWANGCKLELALCDGLPDRPLGFDLIIANPPFINGRLGRIYRDGGDDLGTEVSLAWALRGAERLNPGGRMLLYTGSPIVEGDDPFRRRLEHALPRLGMRLDYEEVDPDIFGGTLERSDYESVERLAAVAATIRRA
jgi:SAM-dependent methyltransferase